MPEAAVPLASPASFPGDVVLRAGSARAVVRPRAGGRVCALELARPDGQAVPVLFPYEAPGVDPVNWGKGGIYPLAPYSGRISHARVHFPGGAADLVPHPNAPPHSLHGHAHGLPWTVQSQDADAGRVVLRFDSPPVPAWPWAIQVQATLQLHPDALVMDMALTAGPGGDGLGPMPAGLGWHPFFLHRPESRLRFSAATRWSAAPDHVPQAPHPVAAQDRFDTPRPLPEGAITTDLSDWQGRFELELPEGDVLQLEAHAPANHLVLHRTAAQTYLCVEPVTHVADGFNLAARGVPGTGAAWLAPGETLRSRLTLRLSPHRF